MRNELRQALLLTVVAVTLPRVACSAAASELDTSDLLNLSLKELSEVEITSVSKHEEKASQAAAAIYVITQEDIRRSGMQTVPELLRMVPGLQVARSGSQNWAISSRGFDGQFANKLLVLIDGRTVYTPVFSGVFWDVQNMLLEDIDRIEVIRGPGATLWGANAVNGVINIITKNAKDTQGKFVTTSVGSDTKLQTGARLGGKEGDLSYRSYAQYQDVNQQKFAGGVGAKDYGDNTQGGFRLDWNTSSKEQTTVQGDVYYGVSNYRRFLPVTTSVSSNMLLAEDTTENVSGANILGRWKHNMGKDSDITLQVYYDLVNRENVMGKGHTQTFDVDFQHNVALNDRNDLTWGLGYRFINSGFSNSFYISYLPDNYYSSLFSTFVQDRFAIIPEKLHLTVGTKLERNDFSGFEYEPSARIAWTPSLTQTLWASVSRAVHAKTQSDNNLRLILAATPTPSPYNAIADTTLLAEEGNSATQSEDVVSYEVGYRLQPVKTMALDLTGFVNEYKNLASLELGTASLRSDPFLGTYFYQPLISKNDSSGETHGFEAAATWEVTPKVKLSGSYSLYYSALHVAGASLVTQSGTAPTHQFNLRSYIDLPHDLQWDTLLYSVDSLPALGIASYTRVDTRLGWIPMPGVDLSLIGQNLFDSVHQEYSGFLYQNPEEIGRSVVARAAVKF